MNPLLLIAAAGMLAAASLASAAPPPNLSVTFVQPDAYTDGGYASAMPGDKARVEVQRDIEQHLQRLAERSLPADQSLKIEVLDIDLAGRFEPFAFRAGQDVRIVRDVSGPHITLRYTLSRAGQVLASAEERLSDLNFLTPFNRYSDSDRLRYEKAMLDRWFDRQIATRP